MKDCWKSIGIAGSIRGSGATHLSVALANYAASGLGEKTACLELGGHGELANWKMAEEEGYFTDQKIHYYPDVKKEQIPIILNRGYERIIMDFGDAYVSFREELLRCDRKVMLLNLNPWQEFAARRMLDAMGRKDWGNIKPLYAGRNAQKACKKTLEREYGVTILEIPLIPEPGRIRADEFSCMDLILGRAAGKNKRRKSRMPG